MCEWLNHLGIWTSNPGSVSLYRLSYTEPQWIIKEKWRTHSKHVLNWHKCLLVRYELWLIHANRYSRFSSHSNSGRNLNLNTGDFWKLYRIEWRTRCFYFYSQLHLLRGLKSNVWWTTLSASETCFIVDMIDRLETPDLFFSVSPFPYHILNVANRLQFVLHTCHSILLVNKKCTLPFFTKRKC